MSNPKPLTLEDADRDAVVDLVGRNGSVLIYAAVRSRNEPCYIDADEVVQVRDWLTKWLDGADIGV